MKLRTIILMIMAALLAIVVSLILSIISVIELVRQSDQLSVLEARQGAYATKDELGQVHTDFSFVNKTMPDSVEFFGRFLQLRNTKLGRTVQERLYVLSQNPGNFIVLYLRQQRFWSLLDSVLASQPRLDDYRYVVAWESWLNPRARSSANAVGLAQLRPAAAMDQGLLMNKHIDERLDPFKALPAGLRHFKMQIREFGDTLLAAAAYNMGARNLIDRKKAQGVDDYVYLILFRETEQYVPNILALKLFSQNPEKYVPGITSLEQYAPYPQVKAVRVKVRRSSTLNDLAKVANISYDEFLRVNQQYLGQSTLPAADYVVNVIVK